MKRYRAWSGAAALAALVALAACDPIASYRDLRGFSKTDPNPATTPFAANLAAGFAAPYPNLATVPPPPTREMTMAEREKMLKGLIADRSHVDQSDQRLRAGNAAPDTPAPVPPPPPLPPGVSAKLPPVAARPEGAKAVKPVKPFGPRKAGEKPEPGPMESSLKMPQIREVPAPEAMTAPPPAPRLPPPEVKAAAAGPMPAPAPSLPAAVAASPYEPPPPPPQVPPIATAAAGPGKAATPPAPPAGRPVGEIDFAAGSASLSAQDRPILDRVATLYRQTPGQIRILGRAAGGGDAAEELKRYRIALDRAQAVAAALRERGIPASKIRTEAAAVIAGSAEERAEIVLEP